MKPGEVQPWWERLALCLLEEGRILDSQAIIRRLAGKYPSVIEPQVAAAAIEASAGNKVAAVKSWTEVPRREQSRYEDATYLKEQLHWPQKAVEGVKLAASMAEKEREAAKQLLK